MEEKLPVFLTREQAALFVLFCKNYDKIGFLISKGIFDVKHGSVMINFDSNNNIGSVEVRQMMYPVKETVYKTQIPMV